MAKPDTAKEAAYFSMHSLHELAGVREMGYAQPAAVT